MGIFEHFPYTNFHELNLDWLLNAVKKLDKKVETIQLASDPVFININAGETESGVDKDVTNVTCSVSPAELANLLGDPEKPLIFSIKMQADGSEMATGMVAFETGFSRATTYIAAQFISHAGSETPETYNVLITIAPGGNSAQVSR